MKLKTASNLKLKDKRVLLRVNFDVPMKNGKILDDSRIKAHLPTIFYLIKKKARIILISHLGDPLKNQKSKIKNQNDKLKIKKEYSLRPVASYINKSNFPSLDSPSRRGGQFPISNFQINSKSKIPKLKVKFIDGLIEPRIKKEIEKMKGGEVILLENLRFYSGEEKNDKNFAKKMASLADIYINDAFPVCHRAHASVSAITKYLPSYAGFLLEKEVKNLSEILEKPKHPFIVLIGGAKISTKLPVIKNLLKIADKILIGGALANTFFASQKLNISNSVYEPEMVKEAVELLKVKGYGLRGKLILPIDVKIKLKIKSSSFAKASEDKQKSKTSTLRSSATAEDGQIKNVKINKLNSLKKEDFKILDIGDETIKLFAKYLKSAKMIVWNGPFGYFEEKPFDKGTREIAKSILKNKKAKIFIGGGETLASLKQARTYADLTQTDADRVFISTGGGAMLEFLSGKILPGLKPLIIKNK